MTTQRKEAQKEADEVEPRDGERQELKKIKGV